MWGRLASLLERVVDSACATVDKVIMEVVGRVTSGKWLFTVGAAYVFVRLSMDGVLKPDDVKVFLGIIITFYFTKKSEEV